MLGAMRAADAVAAGAAVVIRAVIETLTCRIDSAPAAIGRGPCGSSRDAGTPIEQPSHEGFAAGDLLDTDPFIRLVRLRNVTGPT